MHRAVRNGEIHSFAGFLRQLSRFATPLVSPIKYFSLIALISGSKSCAVLNPSMPPSTPPPHPESIRLQVAILACTSFDSSWNGDAYRVVAVSRANESNLLSGEGSRIWGGRWNPPDTPPTCYFALDYATAMEEALAQNRKQGLPDARALPLVTTATSLTLRRTLNLAEKQVSDILGVSIERMIVEPHDDPGSESISQAIGRIAWAVCYQALLVPSAAKRSSRNLVVFPNKLTSGHMEIMNPHLLPKL